MKTLFWLAVVGAVVFLFVFPKRAAADVIQMPSNGGGAGAGGGSGSSTGTSGDVASAGAAAPVAAACGAACSIETRAGAVGVDLEPWGRFARGQA